ncbi:ABC transporter permease [Jiangella alkaliphila]|uniref:Putative ABC transport system permease protein n=1 Tax=Jiangella alkaliphila TaxID=419479 RepID=A0A1H2KMM6_9ACTN|nr:ABC transporter permease [Jiangella alkaliphila]SDU69913.1 putative ABC transport system permease protein [Jiangella alkaliphila]
MTGLVAAFAEAWEEVRIHKVRVIVSLIGVLIAVAAMTVITALGDMARQANAEHSERTSGRPATLQVSAWPLDGSMPPEGALTEAFGEIVERHSIEYSSILSTSELRFRFADGTEPVWATFVDRSYGEMHRIEPLEGRWFTDADERRFAPAAVVNQTLHERLGAPDLRTNPTVVIGGERPVRATVVGVTPDAYSDEMQSAYLLNTHQAQWGFQGQYPAAPSLEVWVPPDSADQLTEVVTSDLRSMLGDELQVDVYRVDPSDFDLIDSQLQWVIRGVSVIALGMGALGLLNIALVTVRYRVREIGVRRSFGATSGRVFFSVMMESVFATLVAGLAGVILAIAIVRNVPIEELIGGGNITDVPAFPVRAAVEGLVAATVVGALAGILPATVAVRVKVIDAIRF